MTSIPKTLDIVEDPQTGDLLLQLTDELCAQMGWAIGDTIKFEDLQNGSFSMRKTDNAPTLG